MGFMDGIRDVLGGFNAVKQIDSDGFDWREKRAAAQAARDQEVQQYEQANQDYLAKSGAEALVGGAEPQDIAAGLPASLSAAQRKFAIDRAAGGAAQSKSALEGQRAYTASVLQANKDAEAARRVELAGQNAQALARVKADIEAGREPSPRDLALIQERGKVQTDLFNRAEAGRNARFGQGFGRPQRVQTMDENGNAVWGWIQPGQQGVPLAPTAIERQVGGMADTVRSNVDEMAQLAPEVTSGRIAGNLSKGSQWLLGPHGKEGEFDFDAKAVIDSVYIKSGKQINATEMGILKQMIPDRGKGNLEEQVRLFGDYANSLLQKYGGKRGAGGGQTATFGGVTYRLKPGANPKLKSSWEPIR